VGVDFVAGNLSNDCGDRLAQREILVLLKKPIDPSEIIVGKKSSISTLNNQRLFRCFSALVYIESSGFKTMR